MADLKENFEKAKDLTSELLKHVNLLDEAGKKNVANALGQKDLIAYAQELAQTYIKNQDKLEEMTATHTRVMGLLKTELKLVQQRRFEEMSIFDDLTEQLDTLDEIGIKNIENALQVKDIRKVVESLNQEFVTGSEAWKESLTQYGDHFMNVVDAEQAEMEKVQDLAKTGAEKVIEPFEKFQSILEGLPGGQFVSKHLGFDTIAADMKEKFSGAMSSLLRTGKADFSALALSGKTALAALVNPLTIAVLLLGLALKRFIEIDAVTREIRTNTGFTGRQLRDMANYAEDMNLSYAKMGVDLEKASEISQALVNTFGSTAFLTEQNADSMARLVGLLGMSGAEAAGLLKTFENIAVTTGDSASNLIGATIQLAKQSGVAPKEVLSDIAKSSETIFNFTNGSAETIARTAVEARRLGISLGSVEAISGKLMDFQSSIESEMQAMVITGKQLNLEQARYYAMTGETDKMMHQITKQLGSAEEISSMLPFEQKALADAIGVSVGELRNMARQQEIVNGLAEGTKDSWQAMKEGGSLEDVLKAEGVMTPLEDLQTSFKAVIVSLSSALVPVFKLLVPVLRVVAFVFEMVGKALNLLFKPLDLLAESFGGLDEIVTS